MPRIFINYRRDDTAGHAGRLFDRLHAKWPGEVFFDVESIAPGRAFETEINDAVNSGSVMLCAIGRRWLNAQDERDQRRLDDPADHVRHEIEAAIARQLPLFPLLFDHAEMPNARSLPTTLVPLASHNAIQISPRFQPEVDRLIAAIAGNFTAFARENPASARQDPATPNYSRVLYEPFDADDRIAETMRSVWFISGHPSWTTRIHDGTLEWINKRGVGSMLQTTLRYVVDASPTELGDCRIEARVRAAPPNDTHSMAGLIFRFDPEAERGYAFLLQPGGTVSLFEREGNSMRPGPSFDAVPDSDGFVRLRVSGDGSDVHFLVNGELVNTILDAAWRDGRPGLMAFGTGRFAFDDVALFTRIAGSKLRGDDGP